MVAICSNLSSDCGDIENGLDVIVGDDDLFLVGDLGRLASAHAIRLEVEFSGLRGGSGYVNIFSTILYPSTNDD